MKPHPVGGIAARSFSSACAVALALGATALPAASGADAEPDAAATPAAAATSREPIMVRMRLTGMGPAAYARLRWRWGGQGVTVADPVVGEVTSIPPLPEPDPSRCGEGRDFILDEFKNDRVVWVKEGVWFGPFPFDHFRLRSLPFITFTAIGKPEKRAGRKGGGPARITAESEVDPLAEPSGAVEAAPGTAAGAPAATRSRAARTGIAHFVLEVELSHRGKVIATFAERSPQGSIASLFLPVRRLAADGMPTPEFLAEAGGLSSYAARRRAFVESLPWASRPMPTRYALVADCFGMQGDFAAHTADPEAMLAELHAVRQLGVNGFRMVTEMAKGMMHRGEGFLADCRRARIGGTADYTVPGPGVKVEGAGCPYHPRTIEGRLTKIRDAVARSVERCAEWPVEEAWLLTQDEIGAFYGSKRSAEHLGACPRCHEAFRTYVKGRGYAPVDFGVEDWGAVLPTAAFIGKVRAEGPAEPEDREVAGGEDADVEQARAKPGDAGVPVSQRGWALLRVLTRDFNLDTSASLLRTVRDAYAAENEKKRRALAEGRTDSPEARRPWLYSYSLRRTSFTMGGDTLDYFDFYRQADNAFMYETSNRDPRIWQWDSYMSDVGRSLTRHFGTPYGVCLKPHRGATVQRALTAVSRGARMIYWYTYGPNWAKGDSFAGQFHLLRKTSLAARLIAAAEDVTYDATWAHAPEVAVVRLRTSEPFENATSWENGKWIYSALAHAHIPVDAISESMLVDQDLSGYRVIYVSGPNIRRDAAEKLRDWVAAGGTLYTSGGGLARDEGNEPLTMMDEVLGVRVRRPMEEWRTLPRYGAVGLPGFREPPPGGTPPPEMGVGGSGALRESVPLLAGREPLEPVDGATVLATYSDGAAAVVRHAFGKGQAFLVGFYPGAEYVADVLTIPYDTARDFRAAKRAYVTLAAAAAGVKPVVDASEPLVEGVLLRNAATGRQAVPLMNWAYRVDDDRDRSATVFTNLTVRIRGTGPVRRIRSAALDGDVPFEVEGGDVVVTVPTMEEGEILLLE